MPERNKVAQESSTVPVCVSRVNTDADRNRQVTDTPTHSLTNEKTATKTRVISNPNARKCVVLPEGCGAVPPPVDVQNYIQSVCHPSK